MTKLRQFFPYFTVRQHVVGVGLLLFLHLVAHAALVIPFAVALNPLLLQLSLLIELFQWADLVPLADFFSIGDH